MKEVDEVIQLQRVSTGVLAQTNQSPFILELFFFKKDD
jgi:hypothetical protein